VLKSDDNPMHVVLRGTSEVPPPELLNNASLGMHLRRLAEYFDLVLVDSPPVNLLADAYLLANHCDAVMLIARAFSTNQKDFDKAVQDLRRFRIIGTVLNGGAGGLTPRRDYYYKRT
jgi:Mrp family chromosome partitioning ATPase